MVQKVAVGILKFAFSLGFIVLLPFRLLLTLLTLLKRALVFLFNTILSLFESVVNELKIYSQKFFKKAKSTFKSFQKNSRKVVKLLTRSTSRYKKTISAVLLLVSFSFGVTQLDLNRSQAEEELPPVTSKIIDRNGIELFKVNKEAKPYKRAPYAVDAAIEELKTQYSEDTLSQIGLNIELTVDTYLQNSIQQLVTERFAKYKVQSAVVIAKQTGEILVIIGSANYFKQSESRENHVFSSHNINGEEIPLSLSGLSLYVLMERRLPSLSLISKVTNRNGQILAQHTPSSIPGETNVSFNQIKQEHIEPNIIISQNGKYLVGVWSQSSQSLSQFSYNLMEILENTQSLLPNKQERR